MSNPTPMPTNAEMPSEIAKLMGWNVSGPYVLDRHEPPCRIRYGLETRVCWGDNAPPQFCPMSDANHSRLAVERCAELNLTLKYVERLYQICREDFILQHNQEPLSRECLIVLAAPAQESRAAYRTLFDHQQRSAANEQ